MKGHMSSMAYQAKKQCPVCFIGIDNYTDLDQLAD